MYHMGFKSHINLNMNSIRYRLYRSFGVIPASQMAILRTYMWRYGTFNDILTEYYSNRDATPWHQVHNIIVMYKGNHPIGWAIQFSYRNKEKSSLGFWIDHKERGNGYGEMLCREAFRRWKEVYDPYVYDGVEEYLWPKLCSEANKS
jgi:RimJ/RimL family protein N-acetyltransferase